MKRNKKRVFFSLLLFACIAALSVVIYAAFTASSGNFKRVIVARTKDTTDSNALRFSSNYLNPYDNNSSTGYGTVPVSVSGDSDVTIGVTVCNYPQDAQSAAWANEADITYTIELKVLTSEFKEASSTSITIAPSQGATLKGGEKSFQLHKITIPQKSVEEISKGYLQIIVRPDDNSLAATSNNILAANLQIIPASTKETAWNGVSGDNNANFSSLDAYNYQISGTEQCTLTLTWKSENVILSDWSIITLLPNVTEKEMTEIKNKGSITFSVGGQDQPTSYMLQFYKAGTNKITDFTELGISLTQSK